MQLFTFLRSSLVLLSLSCPFARLRFAAFAGLGQGDGNGLPDRFFLCRRMAGADRSILLPFIHQCLDIAADNRLAGSFFERHAIPPACRINRTRFPNRLTFYQAVSQNSKFIVETRPRRFHNKVTKSSEVPEGGSIPIPYYQDKLRTSK
jgi:hypothetical protein